MLWLQVQTVEFARASEVLVRAWDSSMNTQPAHITWNLMGMMNNCHFRILVHKHVDDQVRGGGVTHVTFVLHCYTLGFSSFAGTS
jgi:hypothetical protein